MRSRLDDLPFGDPVLVDTVGRSLLGLLVSIHLPLRDYYSSGLRDDLFNNFKMNILQKASVTVNRRLIKSAAFSKLTMANEESKHRMKLPLYDLEPKLENCWVAPNSTVVGEVRIRRWSSVWYNCVIRGDINRVDIHNFTSIGENTVIHTAAALPTGMPAKVYIGRNCVIGRGCTLYSCHIEDDVTIGDKCVILEGARIEKGA
jgi:tetrahydrodipicolinate N-succinyltransferase